MTRREVARERLVEDLSAVDSGTVVTTQLLARRNGLTRFATFRALQELYDEGHVLKSFERIDGRLHAVWALCK